VVSPIDDTPAARAGLKPGDLITHLDGDPVQGMTLPEAVEKMRGPVSSEIRLTIRREGKDPFDVKLVRATIKIQSVRSHLEGDNIAYIRITTFNEQTDVGLNNAMKNLKQEAGGKLRAGCSIRRSRSPMHFSTKAKSCRPVGGVARMPSATTPVPVTSPPGCRSPC